MLDEQNTSIWIPNKNYFPGRNGYTPRYIILHGTAGRTSAEEVARFFQKTEQGDDPVSTHYIIGLTGEVVQCVHEQDSAWGNGGFTEGHDSWWSRSINPNYLTISIEHVKPSTDNSDVLTELQKEASFRLIKSISARYAIPGRWADAMGGITGHYSMDPLYRSFCPGPYPWDELFAYLSQVDQM